MKEQETTERLDMILSNVSSDKAAEEYIKRFTQNQYSGFAEFLGDYIAAHQIKAKELVTRGNISENYIHNILNGNRNPRRDKIIALSIAAGMSLKECNRGLKLAGQSELYSKRERDARIIIAINQGIRSVTELNIMLDDYGLDILE